MVEIHKGVSGPEFLAHLLACDHIAAALEKQGQYLKGLLLQPNSSAILAQLARGQVELKHSKPHDSAGAIALESGHRTKDDDQRRVV